LDFLDQKSTANLCANKCLACLKSLDTALRNALEHAVERQLMSDVPYGVLLSGGLDSSIIAAIAKKYAPRRIETGSISEAWWP